MPRNSGAKENKYGNRKSNLFSGTWNVRTLFHTGATHIITREVERYGFIIVATQETRWQEIGSLEINNHTIFFKKCDDRRQFGTGFIVHKSFVPAVKEFKFKNCITDVETMRETDCDSDRYLIEATLKNTEIKVKVASKASSPVKVTTGIMQGDVLSPILFNLVLEKVIRRINISVDGATVLQNSNINLLAYADDIVLL
ncbi:Reverse transcriptase domain [Cinara cedri]|uniref:Reverse transcriptase domain n=1 Tax=Cinara cedri TaxID=506608 RepID=A0A5E4M004_9HEMI|nr:Reverse transcriptase domain [Cinara cedri]